MTAKKAVTTEMLEKALHDIGHNVSSVRNFLAKNGFKGSLQCSDICPVANYLAKKFPQATSIDVQSDTCSIVIDNKTITCTTPRAVRTFIAHFDAEKYPELKEESRYV